MSFLKKYLPVLAAVGILCMPVLGAPQLGLHAATLTAPVPPASAPSKLPGLPGVALPLVGAIRIKDTGALAQKFASRAQSAAPDYTSGVQAAGQDWATNTAASEDNYVQGVQASIADKRFSRGVQEAGPAKYTQNASTLGAQRYPTGVANAQGAWAKGVQPHLDAMRNANLPPRGPKGSPMNQARANAVATLNRSIKLQK